MRAIIGWLFGRRFGETDARIFLDELDELHRSRLEADGRQASDRWLRKERRRALLLGVIGLFRGRPRRAPFRKEGRRRPSYLGGSNVEYFVHDLRFGLRTLRKRPLFAALVIGTLGLGIGASTTVFSLVNGILLQNMSYARPGELLTIWQTYPAWRDDALLSEAWDKIGLSWPQFLDFRDRARAFREVAVHRTRTMTLTGAGTPKTLDVGEASAGFFSMLGISPVLGRAFLPGEEGPGAPRLVLLSYALWSARFGSDPDIVGRSVTLDGGSFEVIGVLPPEVRVHSTLFNLFRSSIDGGERAVWVPVFFDRRASPGSRDLEAMGRLAPGVSRAQALSELDVILRGELSPAELAFRLTSPRDEVVSRYREPLLLFLAAAGLLLVIACANVATLLLGEAIDRKGEIATRIALGAGRLRIAQQLLAESLMLGALGSVVGMVLTPLGVRGFVSLGPTLPRLSEVAVDWNVLFAAVAIGVSAAVLFGFAPAFLQHRDSLRSSSMGDGRWHSGSGAKLQATLVSGELALTMLLLVTAGLLSKSLMNLSLVDPGFRGDRVATVRVEVPRSHFPDRAALRRFSSAALQSVERIPGVLHAGAIDGLPFPGRISGTTYSIEGRAPDDGSAITARSHRASSGYFETMGIPLLAGQLYSDSDPGQEAERPALVNATMARRYWGWPEASPLGATMVEGRKRYRIIGIVGDVRERHLLEEPLPMVYRHLSELSVSSDFSIVARSPGAPETLVPLMRGAVRAVDPGIPLSQETTIAALQASSTGAERFRAVLVAAFGSLATLLALVGVFGVTARTVSQRTREMGIRMALGAQTRRLIQMVALGTLRAGGIGIAFGFLGALAVNRLLTAFFYGTAPWDAWVYTSASLLLGLLCVVAALVAAARVARVEPMQVLNEL
ncbi:MAG: ABC transporter permease [Gemmatimonadota bacterium]|nr:MAG: ABC transporter permease [Gemmatimonadota bacterium]